MFNGGMEKWRGKEVTTGREERNWNWKLETTRTSTERKRREEKRREERFLPTVEMTSGASPAPTRKEGRDESRPYRGV
jgi:hypothetical protein